MDYIKAEEVLPVELIQEIQKYINGKNVYIPVVTGEKTEWGKKSGYRDELMQRDEQILLLFQQGNKITELAQKFYLSEKSIYRIISKHNIT